jgi:AcrR family transcriptional regulator
VNRWRGAGRRLQWIIALGVFFCSAGVGAAPVDVIRQCVVAAPAGVAGLKALNAVCPRLEESLNQLGLDDTLYDGWREDLSVNGLSDLSVLLDRYDGPALEHAPNISSLPAILEALKRHETTTIQSWWDAIRAWIQEWFAQSDSAIAKWLRQLLASAEVSPTLLKLIAYGLTAALLGAAFFVLVRELKAGGFTRRGASNGLLSARVADPPQGGRPNRLDSAADVFGELLRRLVSRLTQTGRLDADRSLTHRELIAHSLFDTDWQRQAFAAVATTAESVLYGSPQAAPGRFDGVLEQGESLLAGLTEKKPP